MDQSVCKPLPLLFALMTSVAAIASCSGDSNPEVFPGDATETDIRSLPPDMHQGELPILRSQMDASRDRVWVLARDGVHLYNIRTRQRITHVQLPDWHWAGEPYGCAPDLALGRQGEAVVSSDMLPVLWRIDSATLRVTRHELALDADVDKDVGFSALSYDAANGEYFAVSHVHGSLWRIDRSLTRAQKISLSSPVRNACGLSLHARVRQPDHGTSARIDFDLCVRTGAGRRGIALSPDKRSAYVSAIPCES